ncbi:ATP-binding protein [Streptomyces atriruber]|uniref:ATP-binding protein n=1 Tax=Streptomyces atriruber TaxID=545121 RepID=A0ABV3BX06_9ACTN
MSYPCGTPVAQTRAFVLGALSEWRLTGRLDDVGLCISELATNAIRHGTPADLGFVVRVAVGVGRVRVEVRDQAKGVPVPRQPKADACDGRGLFLVEAFADDWGVAQVGGDTKVVWADFKLPSEVVQPSGNGTTRC